jgi:hypothetical protein
MHYKGYTARIQFDEGDGIFWGNMPGLPATTSVSFEGPSQWDGRSHLSGIVMCQSEGRCRKRNLKHAKDYWRPESSGKA